MFKRKFKLISYLYRRSLVISSYCDVRSTPGLTGWLSGVIKELPPFLAGELRVDSLSIVYFEIDTSYMLYEFTKKVE